MAKRILLSLLILLGPTLAWAEILPSLLVRGQIIPFDSKYEVKMGADFDGAIRASVEGAIQNAINHGVLKIGSVSLLKLKDSVKTVRLRLIGNGASVVALGMHSARGGAAYVVETKTVFVNETSADDNPTAEFLEELLLHEVLGALGIDDESYQFSTLLKSAEREKDFIKTLTPAFPLKKSVTPTEILFPEKSNDMFKTHGKGGISVVGSGGDELLSNLKFELLRNLPVFLESLPGLVTQQSQDFEPFAVQLSRPLPDYVTPELFARFKLFVLSMPVEILTVKYGLNEGSVSNPQTTDAETLAKQVNGAVRVMINKERGVYLRFSRKAWTQPMEGLTLEQSRRTYAIIALVHLYFHWLVESVEKTPAR